MSRLLVDAALTVLRRWGACDDCADRWENDVCRCLHRRRGHYDDIGCDKCRCPRFRLKAAITTG